MIRSLIFVLWIYLSMVILAFLFLPFMIFHRKAALFPVRLWMKNVRLSLRWILGIKTVIRGRENVPKGGLLIASKHQTMYDAFVPFLIVDDPAIIIKQELLWYPVFGWYAWRSGHDPHPSRWRVQDTESDVRCRTKAHRCGPASSDLS